MTIAEIIKQVRWCVDEEANRVDRDYADIYFDNIIKAKINTAMRWCVLYADAAILNDGNEDSGIVHDYSVSTDGSHEEGQPYYDTDKGCVVLPGGAMRVSRVRVPGWHKGVSRFINEDSDEYLMQSNNTAKATEDRPVCAVIQSNPIRVEVFPKPTDSVDIEISLVFSPSDIPQTDLDNEDYDVKLPQKLSSAFVYYLAYLVMCAHSDFNKAKSMLEIARQQIAINQSN